MNKSFNYYFIIFNINDLNSKIMDCFFKKGAFEFIFSRPPLLPGYIEQGVCDILPNKNGILFINPVITRFNSMQLVSDFNSCFAFNLPVEIVDTEGLRYTKNYSFECDIENMQEEMPISKILFYDETEWANILKVNADYFYIKNNNEILFGSLDYKQIELLNKMRN
ncbi:MAG: hypothetical protein KF732_10190 [Flavobacteriales bacterium]|nr:hypothetical protein [Flavobacteriales bacterium]